MPVSSKINYLEFPATDFENTKSFYSAVFGWSFVDYGPDYMAFEKAGIDGGFYRSTNTMQQDSGCALVVFYSPEIIALQQNIVEQGGKITKPVFSFPGGRRFHFSDPNGNELAVWTDPE